MLSHSVLNLHPNTILNSIIDPTLPLYHSFSSNGYHAKMIKYWSNNCNTIKDVLDNIALYKGHIYQNYNWINDTENIFDSLMIESRTRVIYIAITTITSNAINHTCIGNI
jgi:hypothetical protein